MRILSKEEREAEFKKRADEATKKAKTASKPGKKQDHLPKIKRQLQELGYKIADEEALAQIIGNDKTLNFDKISVLSEKGIIAFNEEELEKPIIPPHEEQRQADTPQIEFTEDKHNPTWELSSVDSFASGQPHLAQNEQLKPAPKIFSVSEFLEEETPRQQTRVVVKPEETPLFSIHESIDENNSQPNIPQPLKKIEKPVPEKKHVTNQPAPIPQLKETPGWEKGYAGSLKKWCETSVDKKTNQPKREVTTVETVDEKLPDGQEICRKISITVKPLSPIAKKRGDNGAVYEFEKKPQANKIDVTVKNPNDNKRPLNYDYFYALVKAARDSGADTIEFNDIRTPEFRDKLLAAALQFKMKLKNPPGAINLQAEHLQSIPPGCRQYLEKHNEAVKKALQKMGKEIVPAKGSKYGEGPRAEERTHAEKVFIESQQMEEKIKRTREYMANREKEVNSPSTADYDQNPERGNRDPADRRRNSDNRRRYNNNNRPQRPNTR